jgi:hypothetical protein
MGHLKAETYPGMISAAAITGDFGLAVLQEKSDRDVIGPRCKAKGTEEYIALGPKAEVGMRVIEREALVLEPPDDATLASTYQRIKEIHAKAYDWDPPGISEAPATVTGMSRRMRSYVRRLVNEWDLRRLYPGAEVSAAEEEQIELTYLEDESLEESSEPAEEDVR